MRRKTKKKVTIRDVAHVVGVHHSTVSRALSPVKRDKISPEVVQKIERAAKKLGYYPNLVASSLKQNRSFAVGVLIPDLMNPVFPPIIRGIQDTAEAAGYTVITANTDDEDVKDLLAKMSPSQLSITQGLWGRIRHALSVLRAACELEGETQSANIRPQQRQEWRPCGPSRAATGRRSDP